MKNFKLVNKADLDKIDGGKLRKLAPERQVAAIRLWTDQNIKKYGPAGGQDTDQAMQDFIRQAGEYFQLNVGNPAFQAALKLQRGWEQAKVLEGTLGKVTEELWEALPEELQKKLVNVLSSAAPPQGGQGIKSLTGSPKYQGVAYDYELKFLGAFGDHRCYGNKVGSKVEFSVYDPKGSLH